MTRKLIFGFFIGVLLISTCLLSASCGDEVKIMKWSAPPPMTIDVNKKYTAIIVMESGNLTIELFAKDTPVTVNNFVFLARQGYYNGCTFYRVFPGYMAQSGDPTGTGYGGPGYTIPDEITSHSHIAGSVSMANSGADTTGSQFFICYTDQLTLDRSYTVFGQLIGGWDAFLKITPRDPSQNPTFKGDKIITITITEE
jgi:cyclophilin family peptidyl-prolyl cis-trans isomerase